MGSEKIMKSSFTQTCDRFSQFLKERRSFGHLDAFKSFASSEDTRGAKEVSNVLIPKNMEKERISLELFPLMSSLTAAGIENSTKTVTDYSRETSISMEQPKTSPSNGMTIFYGGRVLVFNELPEDMAQEIMSIAKDGTMSSRSQTQVQARAESHQTPRNINNVPTHLTQPCSFSDLPMARRVSLHRFMEKRKHRVAASAPYQLKNLSSAVADAHSQKFHVLRSLYEQQQLELKL